MPPKSLYSRSEPFFNFINLFQTNLIVLNHSDKKLNQAVMSKTNDPFKLPLITNEIVNRMLKL
jgi:hypothetical protein